MPDLAAPSRVGALLRDWRQRRRLSQLDLALDAIGSVCEHHVAGVRRETLDDVLAAATDPHDVVVNAVSGLVSAWLKSIGAAWKAAGLAAVNVAVQGRRTVTHQEPRREDERKNLGGGVEPQHLGASLLKLRPGS